MAASGTGDRSWKQPSFCAMAAGSGRQRFAGRGKAAASVAPAQAA